MADQLTARALPAYGNTVAKTPHIDSLAKSGVVFESFYCNSPLCAPSRFSFLSGRQVSAIGAYDNAAEFPAQVPTFAHYLRRSGYQTVLQRQDAFLRRRPAARLRGALDDGHLSGRLRLDSRIGAASTSSARAGITPWTRSPRRARAPAPTKSITTTASCSMRKAKALRHGAQPGQAAFLHGRLHDPSP
jgi:hypothetical protein